MSYTLSRKYTLLDPQLGDDPYPIYKSLRSEAPIYWDEPSQVWLVSRYADVNKLLFDPRFTTKFQPPAADDVERNARRQIFEMLDRTMYWVEPPNHAHLRNLAEKAFMPKVAKMDEQIQQIVDGLLDKVQTSGRMDAIADFASLLPLIVLAQLLDVPVEESVQLQQWGINMVTIFGNAPTTLEDEQQILQNLLAMTEYFRTLVKQRLQAPKDDLISALTLVEEQGDSLSQQEIIMNIGLLLAAGLAVATYLIGNGLLALLRFPDQMQKLQDDPTLIGSAIDEFLRYETSLQWVIRRATEDTELHDQLIRKDQLVFLSLGSANRDEAQFRNPDQLDITRKDNRHLSFGYGPHYCLGASLFRQEAKIAISTVLRRLKGLRLETDSLEWVNAPSLRALKSLPVAFEA